MQTNRYLALLAGPFRLALPLSIVRQILEVGGDAKGSHAPTDPRALGVAPVTVARLLGEEPLSAPPALFLCDGHLGPVLLAPCALLGVFDAGPPVPLPPTVACRWPGLFLGVVFGPEPRLALDPRVFLGLIEADTPPLEPVS